MIQDVQHIDAPPVRNRLHHAAGAVLLALNAVRHRVLGYRTPRPGNAAASHRYAFAVYENWTRHLRDYLQRDLELEGRHVLEIGPGPDLGTGLLWIDAGAASYTAVDVHALIGKRQAKLHRNVAAHIAGEDVDRLERLYAALERFEAGDPEGPLRYRVLSDFDLTRLVPQRFDLVVSHSAFEHLTNVEATLDQLGEIVSDRAHLVAEIDLQTHTRWIRDADPLNIYRYTRRFYRSFHFSGIPNRVRPDEYLHHLEHSGWYDLRVYPRRVLDAGYIRRIEPRLAPRFRGDLEHLAWLSLVLCASRHGERSWRGPVA